MRVGKKSVGRVAGLAGRIGPIVEVESEEDDPPAEMGTLERVGIERELRVVRVGPNPRMVLCEYYELAQRRVCVVNVGVNRKWVKGMRIRMKEPVSDLEYGKPWVYRGKGPRRRGWPKEV